MELALEAASLHPAQLLGLEKRKGTLDFGADAGQGLMWAPRPLKTWELRGTWDSARAGGIFPMPRWPCPPPASARARFPIRPGFLVYETRPAEELPGPLSLVPYCQEYWLQDFGQPAMGWGALPKSCCRLQFPHQLLGRGGEGNRASLRGDEAPGSWLGVGVAVGPPTPAATSPPASDPDFVVLDDSLHVRATYISGELVWQAEEARQ